MKRIAVLALFVLTTAAPSFAQITVIDPTMIRQQIQQLIETQKQLVQLQQMYTLYRQQYNLFQSEYQSLPDLPNRYRYTFQNWQQFAVNGQYGNTGGWANGINTGQAAAIQNGYRQLIGVVRPIDVTVNSQRQQDWRQQYGLLQLQDGAVMNAMQAGGTTRTNLQQNAATLRQLESDASNPSLQSDKQIAQQTRTALLLLIHNLQDTNRMIEADLNLQSQILAQQRWDRGRTLNQTANDRQALGQ